MDAPPPQPTPPVAIGDVVNDRYVVESFVGSGDVSAVYGVRNIMTQARLALKCLKPEAFGQAKILERFAREARAAISIESAFVVTVHDVGTLPSGSPFLVMEYLEGVDLATWMEGRDAVSIRQGAELALQMCEALATAHARGVVHRDIRPSNLFVAERAGVLEIKVLDIGISKSALTGSAFGANLPIVKTLNLAVAPVYLAPEQLRSAAEVDGRADIWSIGMVLYELLAKERPFAARTIMESCAAILQSEPPSIVGVRPDVPGGLAQIVERCLKKDPAQRFQSVAELAAALTRYAPSRARASAERAAKALRERVDLATEVEPSLALETVFSSHPPPVTSSAPPAQVQPQTEPPSAPYPAPTVTASSLLTSSVITSAPPLPPRAHLERFSPPPPSSAPITAPSPAPLPVPAPSSSVPLLLVSPSSSMPAADVAPLPAPGRVPSPPPMPVVAPRLFGVPPLVLAGVVIAGLALLGFFVRGALDSTVVPEPTTHAAALPTLSASPSPLPEPTTTAAAEPIETAIPESPPTVTHAPVHVAAPPRATTPTALPTTPTPVSNPAPTPPPPTGRVFRREM